MHENVAAISISRKLMHENVAAISISRKHKL